MEAFGSIREGVAINIQRSDGLALLFLFCFLVFFLTILMT